MNVAFIPVRGGSKSIPLKNIKNILGRPLVYWTIKAACECRYIDKVYVATDSEKIKDIVENLKKEKEEDSFSKIIVIGRSAESATDTASTEFAMLEFAREYEFDNIALVQATSPLLQSSDLDKGFEALNEAGTDSVLSLVRQKRFCWNEDERGFIHASNYDIFHRPRRQEFGGYLVENGAFYISSRELLLKSQNRISGNIKGVEMDADTFIEIDEPSDWAIVEALMKKRNLEKKKEISEIKLFLTDCDGCLTDGGMYYSELGDELKKFNTKDGMGLKFLREKGIITGIITGENVNLNIRRAEKLKLDIMEAGCENKLEVIKKICRERNILPRNVCYIGDDVNDIEVIKFVGLGCCPADAILQVKEASDYISCKKGGQGVIRDCIDYILSRDLKR